MSSKYKVIWASVAEKDLKNIIEYIAEESPQNALKILTKIRQNASGLYTLPERGRIVSELKDQGILLYRELIIAPWRLIYRISGQEIFVLSVIDSRRNVEDVLLKRFIDKE
ncbi:MAG: type II toxin-antitoxin system RelE/ParE family toxin [Desulfobacula sp.]|jgi:addiction module RelE/StbE family toxin|uniref:type II toxin-antitoxin system RelE/ParE family toxin n=1 Tax=Desulfobacula sp. TaxID=2593537 RepID=UPI001DD421C6|nr:type II toxin-antitoxin system RelE/ParE family toxin [Desulfobacula sp.]MBT3484953.1 type II toxin-antitoxin system RelE/ParE family toxin [Desulfobacula sp.]MBT3803211.1 type II toxin-antitoxin system RelE/ParE family toxin [Desulfobacula sp.]MBT4024594.1 type II toxin-antitoxin system RelE/ParE family toxin [Desulfobacula sp.]MBT4200268.1 type II toxin-antitoxin system RelE/ParE family toxin [Desulfobacula sp.]